MLKPFFSSYIECGTDEAGRGCLAGPVTAAAVILPKDFRNKILKIWGATEFENTNTNNIAFENSKN